MGEISLPYWYLYAYISFLMCLPILRKLVCNLETHHFLYIIILCVIFNGVIPSVEFLGANMPVHICNHLTPWIINNMILFPCLGFFLEHKISIAKIKKYLPAMWITNILCIAFTAYLTYLKIVQTNGMYTYTNDYEYQSFLCYFTPINAITIFLTMKVLLSNTTVNKNIVTKLIGLMGRCSFGIYLVHVFVLCDYTMNTLFSNPLNINRSLNICISVLCVFLVSFVISFILQKIPLINKLIS